MRDLLQQIRSAKTDNAETPEASAEAALWRVMLRHPQAVSSFQRRCPMGPFVAPFLSQGYRIIIEILPTEAMSEQQARRAAYRLAYLETQGFRVMRFNSDEVLADPQGILDMIVSSLRSNLAA
jgi:very-short-patch-repair endonuclease